MASPPLHPNLARLAAAYDEIFTRYRDGRLSAEDAKVEISALVARDDEGVLWSIDAQSGQWLRRARNGSLVPDNPPTYGLATPTAHDLTRESAAFNPDVNVAFHAVDDELLHAPTSLAGSTRRRFDPVPGARSARMDLRKVGVAVLAVVVVAILVLGWRGGDDQPEAPDTTPTSAPDTTPAPAPTTGAPAVTDPAAPQG